MLHKHTDRTLFHTLLLLHVQTVGAHRPIQTDSPTNHTVFQISLETLLAQPVTATLLTGEQTGLTCHVRRYEIAPFWARLHTVLLVQQQ